MSRARELLARVEALKSKRAPAQDEPGPDGLEDLCKAMGASCRTLVRMAEGASAIMQDQRKRKTHASEMGELYGTTAKSWKSNYNLTQPRGPFPGLKPERWITTTLDPGGPVRTLTGELHKDLIVGISDGYFAWYPTQTLKMGTKEGTFTNAVTHAVLGTMKIGPDYEINDLYDPASHALEYLERLTPTGYAWVGTNLALIPLEEAAEAVKLKSSETRAKLGARPAIEFEHESGGKVYLSFVNYCATAHWMKDKTREGQPPSLFVGTDAMKNKSARSSFRQPVIALAEDTIADAWGGTVDDEPPYLVPSSPLGVIMPLAVD